MSSIYLPEKRALFLHVPRTGGTWVGEAVRLTGVPMERWSRVCPTYRTRKHTILQHYDKGLLDRVDYVFAFVRHPESYYKSVWRFTCRVVEKHPEKMRRQAFSRKSSAALNEAVNRWKPDFAEWIEDLLENEPCWVTRWYERYVGPDRGEFCHYVGRTETLEEDTGEVMGILGYAAEWERSAGGRRKIKMARNGVSRFQAPPVEWDADLLERVLRSERVVVRRFFGEESSGKRVYRDALTGEPT